MVSYASFRVAPLWQATYSLVEPHEGHEIKQAGLFLISTASNPVGASQSTGPSRRPTHPSALSHHISYRAKLADVVIKLNMCAGNRLGTWLPAAASQQQPGRRCQQPSDAATSLKARPRTPIISIAPELRRIPGYPQKSSTTARPSSTGRSTRPGINTRRIDCYR